MRIFMDGKEWQILHMEALSREEILEMIKEELACSDQVITDILSDGESLSEEDFLTVPDGIDVEIFSSTAGALGLDVLEQVERETSALDRAVTETVKDLREGNHESGHERLHGLLDNLAWISQALADFRDAFSGQGLSVQEGTVFSASLLGQELEQFHQLLCEGRGAEALLWYQETWRPELKAFQDQLKQWKQRLVSSLDSASLEKG